MRSAAAIALASIGLITAAGCGDAGSANARPEPGHSRAAASASTTGSADAARSSRGVTLEVVNSRYGKVIADSKGEALYLFTKDGRGPSQCYGACATAWPPFLTKGKPKAGKGIAGSRLGTTRRKDGKLQVTYRGQPLYYYVADKPGLILCQNVTEYGGDWLVVAPSGRAIR